MTFRLRLALAAALAVAIAVAVASGVVYAVMRNQLRANVDHDLVQQALSVQQDHNSLDRLLFHSGFPNMSAHGPSSSALYMQIVVDDRRTLLPTNESAKVPVSDATIEVASQQHKSFFTNATVGGTPSRIYTAYLGQAIDGQGVVHGIALQVVRSVTDVNHTLDRLQLILLLIVAGGVAAGALGGALVSRAALVPVRRLTTAAESITRTGDPSERVTDAGGRDELSRLGTAFNTMLAALEDSLETQRRFVADASHELRTPLTSLQTNIEVLKQQERLAPGQRSKLFADLEREAHEMRDLIAGLLELARGDAHQERTVVQFDELVESAVERARSRFPNVRYRAQLEPTKLEGVPERLDRAVWNLLENAGKWSPPGATVDVALANRELCVRDRGPGISAEDRAHIFDRFYRSSAARALPGSGLGLAIVREVAESHDASVAVEDVDGGGALFRIRLPQS